MWKNVVICSWYWLKPYYLWLTSNQNNLKKEKKIYTCLLICFYKALQFVLFSFEWQHISGEGFNSEISSPINFYNLQMSVSLGWKKLIFSFSGQNYWYTLVMWRVLKGNISILFYFFQKLRVFFQMAIKLINIHVIAFDTMSWFLRHESLIFGLG